MTPTGPAPPVPRPQDDAFEWGVGEEADLIILSATTNVSLAHRWSLKDWYGGFVGDEPPPRLTSSPAVSRISSKLATQIHDAQVLQGLHVLSEAMPLSFAFWHGMKIARPPFPVYGQHPGTYIAGEIDVYLNGGPPSKEHDGMAWGTNAYGYPGLNIDLQSTWKWTPQYAGRLFDTWLSDGMNFSDGSHPNASLLQVRDGEIYLPNVMLHPVKTNP